MKLHTKIILFTLAIFLFILTFSNNVFASAYSDYAGEIYTYHDELSGNDYQVRMPKYNEETEACISFPYYNSSNVLGGFYHCVFPKNLTVSLRYLSDVSFDLFFTLNGENSNTVKSYSNSNLNRTESNSSVLVLYEDGTIYHSPSHINNDVFLVCTTNIYDYTTNELVFPLAPQTTGQETIILAETAQEIPGMMVQAMRVILPVAIAVLGALLLVSLFRTRTISKKNLTN